MLRRFVLLAVLLSLPAARAEDADGRWENLKLLAKGQSIQVVETDMKSWGGPLLAVTPDAISLRVDRGFFRQREKTIPRASVLRVSTLSHKRNMLIGLAVGAAAGGAVAAALAPQVDRFDSIISKGQVAALMLSVGCGAGTLIGYSAPSHRTVYRSSATRP